ncbi:MAG: hypothetical protein ACLFR0_00750 [Alphaproteobacteria bacterium]
MDEDLLKLRSNKRLLEICTHRTIHHIPDADVEYMPGIDAKGNFIVAPDIGIGFSSNIYPLQIPLELDIVERFDLDVPLGIISDPIIAGIVVHENGMVTYNGHNVSQKVETFCVENKIIEAVEGEKSDKSKPADSAPPDSLNPLSFELPTDGEVIQGGY